MPLTHLPLAEGSVPMWLGLENTLKVTCDSDVSCIEDNHEWHTGESFSFNSAWHVGFADANNGKRCVLVENSSGELRTQYRRTRL